MKKFILASLLALPLVAFSGPQASAWCDFKLGASVGMSFSTSGCSWGLYKQNCPGPMCDSNPTCFGGAGYGNTMMYGMGQMPYAQPTPDAARPQPVQYQPTWTPNSGFLPVGYASPSSGYNYYQAPSYWYGY